MERACRTVLDSGRGGVFSEKPFYLLFDGLYSLMEANGIDTSIHTYNLARETRRSPLTRLLTRLRNLRLRTQCNGGVIPCGHINSSILNDFVAEISSSLRSFSSTTSIYNTHPVSHLDRKYEGVKGCIVTWQISATLNRFLLSRVFWDSMMQGRSTSLEE